MLIWLNIASPPGKNLSKTFFENAMSYEDDDLFDSETRRNSIANPFQTANYGAMPNMQDMNNMQNMQMMNSMHLNQMNMPMNMNSTGSRINSINFDDDDDLFQQQNDYQQQNPFMPPQAPPGLYQAYHHKIPSSNYTLSTMVGEDYKLKRLKTVAFQESEPQYPTTAYGQQYNQEYDDFEDFEYMDPEVTRQLTYQGENYMTNTLEDVDPFGDDDNESLFSSTSADFNRNKSIKFNDKEEYDLDTEDGDFKPKLNYSKTLKRTKLVHGNYVVDCPVPKTLLDTYGKKIVDCGKEMSFLRYSAVTCGPSNFSNFNYNLRQVMYTPQRETEIMCVITMYNEDEILLAKTLKGVFENVKNLTNRNHPEWGENSWKKIVVTIVSDGRVALNTRTEMLLKALGIYQDTYAKSKINQQSVKAHVFEYTSTVGIETINDDKIHFTVNDNPVQFLFCLKEKNTRKINSHRWCFQSFAPVLNPKVVMLLDCGTVPEKDSFYYLWRAFNDPNVAGACGEMKTGLGQNKSLLLNPLVAAQNFEYKISNVLDKPMESVFGFISVLPGAFSAYRYEALLNVNGKGPLEKYFKGEFLHHTSKIDDEEDDEKELKQKSYRDVGIFTSNMYLAEDRILCFELVAKKGYNYILRYVNEAKAETDVPETIEDFVLQRRRWLNGSLFAACYAIFHWTKIWKSNHSLLRKFVLQIEFYYQLVVILVSWFSLASFFLVFNILTSNLGSETIDFVVGKYLSIVALWLYVIAIICTFVLGFGNTPRGTKKFYLAIAIVFAILMVYMLFAAVYLAVVTITSILDKTDFKPLMLASDYKFRDLVVSMATTYVLYFVAAIVYGEPSFMATSFIQYLLLSPTYVNVLNIYSFCNINDISWGTREDIKAKDLGQAKSTDKLDDVLMIVNGGDETEINDAYISNLEDLRVVPDKVQLVNTKKDKDDNYYALIRTITVLVWLFTNLLLIAIVLEIGGFAQVLHSNRFTNVSPNSEIFLSIILWLVAGLAVYRFIGSVLFLVFKVVRPLKWKFRGVKR